MPKYFPASLIEEKAGLLLFCLYASFQLAKIQGPLRVRREGSAMAKTMIQAKSIIDVFFYWTTINFSKSNT
jgi:hypothetical protein